MRTRILTNKLAGTVVFVKLLLSSSLLLSASTWADVTARDMQVVARTLGFLETPLSGSVSMGILHESSDPASRLQAERIAGMLGAGLRVGNLQLTPLLVPLSEAASVQVDFFLLTESLGTATAELPALLASRRLTCITTDLDQVRDGSCAIGVRSAPKVEILVNRNAASASGTLFSTAFRMMITEF